MEAAVAGYERNAKVEGSCCDDSVGHIGNKIAGDGSQGASDVVIERKNLKCRVVMAELADNPLERIGGDASAFDQVNNLNEGDGGNMAGRPLAAAPSISEKTASERFWVSSKYQMAACVSRTAGIRRSLAESYPTFRGEPGRYLRP